MLPPKLRILVLDRESSHHESIAELEKFDIVIAESGAGGLYRLVKCPWSRSPSRVVESCDIEKALELLGVESVT